MIQFINVSKVYPNGNKALADVSFQVDKGEFVFLVGPSGAGKSTVIRMMFREELPTRGQIMIGGKSILRLRRSEIPILRRNMGVVFQDYRLLSDRTAYENIAFAMQVVEAAPWEIRERVPQVLEMVGLSHRADHYPHQLSGGEQQRVAIARAIVNNPRILVADEPTGNLDAETSWQIIHLLNEINKRGTTIVVATHNREIVTTMRKRVLTLEGGALVRDVERGTVRREA